MKRKAVALRYEKEKDSAPRIVAKGVDETAEKIMEIARAHGIPLYEDKSLLKKVYQFETGEYIPEEFYQVIAALLAWVYSLDKKEAR